MERYLLNTFDDGKLEVELGFLATTFYFIMILELNFDKRQEQAVAISLKSLIKLIWYIT